MGEPKLTRCDVIVLRYLDGLMEATAKTIGQHVMTFGMTSGGFYSGIGGAICGRLRKRGFVVRLHNEGTWRITSSGRAALADGWNDRAAIIAPQPRGPLPVLAGEAEA